MPSSRATSSAIAGASASVSAKSGSCSCARSTNRRTAVYCASPEIPSVAAGTGSGRTGQVCSPGTRSGARLEAISATAGAAFSTAWASAAAGLSRCSQLSRISSACRSFRWCTSDCSSGRPGSSRTPSTCAASASTRWSSRKGARSRNQTPSGNSAISSAATCRLSRVLPRPPAPSSVTSLALPSSRRMSASSRSRPMKAFGCSGRLFGTCLTGIQRPSLCTTRYTFSLSGGRANEDGSSPIANSSIGSARPFTTQCPSGRTCTALPAGERRAPRAPRP